MRALVLLLTAAVFLTGCETVVSEVAGCPQLRTYSPEVQAKAADELDALPPGSVLPDLIGDYAVMREELRAGGC